MTRNQSNYYACARRALFDTPRPRAMFRSVGSDVTIVEQTSIGLFSSSLSLGNDGDTLSSTPIANPIICSDCALTAATSTNLVYTRAGTIIVSEANRQLFVDDAPSTAFYLSCDTFHLVAANDGTGCHVTIRPHGAVEATIIKLSLNTTVSSLTCAMRGDGAVLATSTAIFKLDKTLDAYRIAPVALDSSNSAFVQVVQASPHYLIAYANGSIVAYRLGSRQWQWIATLNSQPSPANPIIVAASPFIAVLANGALELYRDFQLAVTLPLVQPPNDAMFDLDRTLYILYPVGVARLLLGNASSDGCLPSAVLTGTSTEGPPPSWLPRQSKTLAWPAIAGIIAGVVLIAVFLVLRRRRTQMELIGDVLLNEDLVRCMPRPVGDTLLMGDVGGQV